MTRQKIAFIVNPISGTKDKEQILSYAKSYSGLSGSDLTFYKTTGPCDATVAAKRFAEEGYATVVAVGGDGTVNEVAQGLMHTPTCLGIIPTGSGNGLARDLGIPMNYQKAVATLVNGNSIAIDAGKLNDKTFFCTSGVGYDAFVGNRFAQAKTRGILTYVKIAIGKFLTYKPENYRLQVNGKAMELKAFLITVANASQWGNNAHIAPEADMTDGLFDVVIVSPFPLYAAPTLGIKMFRSKLNRSQYVSIIRCDSLTIEREQGGYIHYDGEPGTMGTNLSFSIIPTALNVIAGR